MTTVVVLMTIEADAEDVDAGESDCTEFICDNKDEDVSTDIALPLDPESVLNNKMEG